MNNKLNIESNKKKARISLPVYLCYLLIVILAFAGVTFSSYVTKAEGQDSARVAAVAVNSEIQFLLGEKIENTDGEHYVLMPGMTQQIPFRVVNSIGTDGDKVISEVAQNYTITLKSTGNLPLKYQLQCTDDTSGGTGISNGTLKDMVIGEASETGTLPPADDATHTYTLTVTWPADKNEAYLADEIDLITVVVDAVQID